MEQPISAGLSGTTSTNGRRLFWAGIGLTGLGLIIYAVQFGLLKRLVTPWYAPVLATAGVALLLVATVRRPSLGRYVGLAAVALVCAFEWFGVFALALPKYTGPAVAGKPVPAFTAVRADGSPFTERDLADGTPTALVFFRGHW